MTVYYVFVFGIVVLFCGSVVWALWWALKGGQFSRFADGATSIFDEDEPVGRVTDAFPDKKDEVEAINREREGR
jgi:cbb3-type cytochrome oxidase maturation protein